MKGSINGYGNPGSETKFMSMTTYAELANLSAKTAEGISVAYLDTGGDGNPVLFQHFLGNPDNWDRALVDEMGGS